MANGQLADLYEQQGRLEEACTHYAAAAEDDPSGWAASKAGSTLANLHRDNEAVKWWREAVPLQPANSNAQHELALCLQRLGQQEQQLSVPPKR